MERRASQTATGAPGRLRQVALAAGLLLVALAVALWASGASQGAAALLLERIEAAHRALAGQMRALAAGAPGAMAGLLGVAAGYGFLHAAGPGHGKALIGSVAFGSRAGAVRLAAIALAGSLGQGVTAILLVYGGFAVIGLAAGQTLAAAETWLEPLGLAAVALIGAWLAARGLHGVIAPDQGGCGHHHGPDPAALSRLDGPGAMAAVIAGIAIRPCTGAILVLVAAWRLDLLVAGALAVLAMSLGTGAFTAAVGWAAAAGREGLIFGAGQRPRRLALLAPGLQMTAGLVLLAIGGTALCLHLAA